MKQVATVADTILLRQTLQLISLTNDNYDSAYFPESETVGRILGLYRALRWSYWLDHTGDALIVRGEHGRHAYGKLRLQRFAEVLNPR
jgi:hypothetical protein